MKNESSNNNLLVNDDFAFQITWKAKFYLVIIFLFLAFSLYSSLRPQKNKTVITEMSAEQAYQNGFIYDVMNNLSLQGVSIANRMLFENDAPGAGYSERGVHMEPIHAGVLVRKQFYLNDTRARRAHIILYMSQSRSSDPYFLVINGAKISGGSVRSSEVRSWRWVEIPVSLLKKGLNEVIVGSDAPKGKGYKLLFAREDEYNDGGGKYTYLHNTAMISADQIRLDEQSVKQESNASYNSFNYFQHLNQEVITELNPIIVGATSAKSLDGGETWIEGKLGPQSDISGEYTIRLSLDRFKPNGILDSPPIDLWSGIEEYPSIQPNCKVEQLRIDVNAFIPKDTEVTWQMRMGATNDMYGKEWDEWKTLGNGAVESFEPVITKNLRFIQWRAVLKTSNPLHSPIVKNVSVKRRLSYNPPPPNTYYAFDVVNPSHQYSSFRMSYENIKNPELKTLQNRLNINSLIKNARGDFEKINLLRHFVSGIWFHSTPLPQFPEWNANKILDRKERLGGGGMCIQFSIVFMQALQSLGYNVRHINIFSHESVEVYIDELGSWVHVDPESFYDSYEFSSKTGSPLSVLDQHKYFLKELGFSASNPIDWRNPEPWTIWKASASSSNVDRFPVPISFSTFTDFVNNPNQPPPQHKLAGFVRFIPRNDFLSRPTPRPLTQGVIEWPWNGYINWYDEATPRRLEYALHTDRVADFYPTLNTVEYTASYDSTDGQINIKMITVTPNFKTFEINIDGQGWESSPNTFVWHLRPSALNTIEMRTRNSGDVIGKSSRMSLFWHYREPFKPRQKNN